MAAGEVSGRIERWSQSLGAPSPHQGTMSLAAPANAPWRVGKRNGCAYSSGRVRRQRLRTAIQWPGRLQRAAQVSLPRPAHCLLSPPGYPPLHLPATGRLPQQAGSRGQRRGQQTALSHLSLVEPYLQMLHFELPKGRLAIEPAVGNVPHFIQMMAMAMAKPSGGFTPCPRRQVSARGSSPSRSVRTCLRILPCWTRRRKPLPERYPQRLGDLLIA